MGGGDEVLQQLFHGRGEAIHFRDVIDHGGDPGGGERFVVRDESIRTGHVGFGLPVATAIDGLVGTLEEEGLAVGEEFHAGVGGFWIETGEAGAGDDGGGGDVVFDLDLYRGIEIRPELIDAPGAFLLGE